MSDVLKTDVCIVGSGPSGASTSLMLSKLKIHHCIVDKAVFPRDKTCGDGLILYAYKSMKLLGEDLFKEFLKSPKFIHSKKIKLHINNTLDIQFKESQDRDMVISYAKRIDFDHFLVRHLSDRYSTTFFGNGVRSLEKKTSGTLVKLKTGKEILAKIVVGADGVQSIVSRKLTDNKINRKFSSTFVSAYYKGVEEMLKGNDAEIRIIYKKMPLFFYIFPLADGQVNVSLGGRTDNIKKYQINLLEEVESIIKSHVKVKHKFLKATKVSSWRGWSIPFHFGKQTIVGDNFLLVGDAAGLANAFYKEGVGTGMMSGIIAAKNIEKYLKTDVKLQKPSLIEYEKDIKNEFGKLLKFSHVSLRFSKFKSLFYYTVYLFKNRVERRSFKMIKKRSY